MRAAVVGLAICSTILIAAPASAKRTVDYSVDDVTMASWAVEQGVSLTAWPIRGNGQAGLVIVPSVDHEVLRGGIYCSAWKVENPISQLIRQGFDHWGAVVPLADSTPASIGVTIKAASTFSRCVGVSELKSVCITRVTIDAEIAARGEPARPVRVSVERSAKGIGACAGLTRGIALVSREAVIALIGKL